jgi:hypothetical protein
MGTPGGNPVANGDPTGQFILSLGIGSFVAAQIRGGRDVATLSTGARVLYNFVRAARLAGIFAESWLYMSLYTEGNRLAERDRVVGTGGMDVTDVLIHEFTDPVAFVERGRRPLHLGGMPR